MPSARIALGQRSFHGPTRSVGYRQACERSYRSLDDVRRNGTDLTAESLGNSTTVEPVESFAFSANSRYTIPEI